MLIRLLRSLKKVCAMLRPDPFSRYVIWLFRLISVCVVCLYCISFSLLHSWTPQCFLHWARARICYHAYSTALFAVPRCEGAGIYVHGLWSMMCHVRSDMIWYDMAIWYAVLRALSDMIWYVVAPASGGDHYLFAESHDGHRLWHVFCYAFASVIWVSTSDTPFIICMFCILCSVMFLFTVFLCFTYSVHISYWPPVLRGLRFMPRRYTQMYRRHYSRYFSGVGKLQLFLECCRVRAYVICFLIIS